MNRDWNRSSVDWQASRHARGFVFFGPSVGFSPALMMAPVAPKRRTRMNDQQRAWALAGAKQSIIAALDAFPELAGDFGITQTTPAETIGQRHHRTFTPRRTAKRVISAAGRKRIGLAASKRWAQWRKDQKGKGRD